MTGSHRAALRLILLALLLVPAAPAFAQAASGPYLEIGDVMPGSCVPQSVLAGQQVDCRFPLERDLPLDPGGGPYVAEVDLGYYDAEDEQVDCAAENGNLVCRGVPTGFSVGSHDVRVRFGWGDAGGVLATAATVEWSAVPVAFTNVNGDEPFTAPGRPLRLWVDAWEADRVQARVFPRDGGEAIATLPVPISADGDPVEIDLGVVPAGRYRLQPCVGPDPCEEIPGASYAQVGTGDLIEAVPGHNRINADRINLVLAGSGFPDQEAFRSTAVDLLGLDGPLLLDADDEVLSDQGESYVGFVEWGPFAGEPLRSHLDRFNLWLLADPVADHHALFWPDPPEGAGLGPDGGVLPDVQITTLHLLPPGRWLTSEAAWPSFTGTGPALPDRDDLYFAGAYVALPAWGPRTEADTLTHELGHGLFDLRDEYPTFDRSITHGYPNCAPDLETAEEWWGAVVGEVDPFVHEYIRVMEGIGQWVPEGLVESLTVGFEMGGCYGALDGDGAVRPTGESIMNGQIPVFGMVNRIRAEKILGLWTGRETLSSAGDLLLDCSRTEADLWAIECRGSLAPYVDAPERGLAMAVGTVRKVCLTGPVTGAVPVEVGCGPVDVDGMGGFTVEIGPAGGVPLIRTSIEAIDPGPVSLAIGFGGSPPVEVSEFPLIWLVGPAVLLAASVSYGGWLLVTRRHRPG